MQLKFQKKKLYTVQVLEEANSYHSKRKNYTAQVSEEKTCIQLNFQK